MINPRDLFEQIGFVVDSPSQTSPYKSKRQPEYNQKPFENMYQINLKKKTIDQDFQKPEYVTSLEIQLGEDESHLLQIKSYDDPYELAINFCKKHNLNQLAVEIVENKIIEAMKRQEQKNHLKILQTEHEHIESYRSKNPKQLVPFPNGNQQFVISNKPYHKKTEIHEAKAKQNQIVSRLITPSKQPHPRPSVSKSKQKSATKRKEQAKTVNKKANPNLDKACQNLYLRGVLQTKALEEKRIKRQQQIEKKEEQELTFKPKINEVSEKIIEFRKQTGTVPLPNAKKMKRQMSDQLYQELVECTFIPEINPISKIIVHNREAYRNEDDHFNKMFNTTEKYEELFIPLHQQQLQQDYSENKAYVNKKSKEYLMKKKQLGEKDLFKPRLNPKSVERIREPFNVRLSRAIEAKQKIRDGEYMNDQYTFQPQVGRAPYYQPVRGQTFVQNKQNLPVWEQLYKESQIRAAKNKQKHQNSKSQKKLASVTSGLSDFESLQKDDSRNSQIITAKGSSNLHYENLIQKRINTVFELLDSDQDGMISPNTIGIENLSKNVLIFLKPIFEEMDELNAELNYNEFKRAVINLLNDSDPYKKGLFLGDNSKKQSNEPTFAPKINKKSRQMADGRSNSQIHLELYEQGVKNQRRKEFMLEKERARKEERELQECSFKPCLHLGRKEYHPSILDRKLSQINFSVNQSSSENHEICSYQEDEDN